MKRKTVWTAAVLAAVVAGASPAAAADGKTIAGWSAILAGSGLVAGAFNYEGPSCPSGYSTHTYTYPDGTQDVTCVRITSFGSDVREGTGSASFERPWAMWSGVAAIGAGSVLLFLPKRAQEIAPSVSVTPNGWQASKTVRFGK